MAAKSYRRTLSKEKGSNLMFKTTQETQPDEIALRDEIFQLKRQLMVLRRTNQQNLVKFRKYEDEAKRKDRQIEQLMDPRKNADVGKILSTKGAAILMNLKDQNNSLVQMILNKDLQIRRLMAEIKTSKLYSASRKSELYRAEIIRLRNLLIKSQEMLKESIDLQNRTKSICFNENPLSETSSSSNQSSPRDLEELRFTIQSLETHIKYSNELLAKKNQEILILTDKLNTVNKTGLCKTCKSLGLKEPYSENFQNGFLKHEEFLGVTSSYQNTFKFDDLTSKPVKMSSGEEILELFEKAMSISPERKVPNSAPSCSLKCLTSSDCTPKRNSPSNDENVTEEDDEILEESKNLETYLEHSSENLVKWDPSTNQSSPPKLQKSILHELATSEILKEKKRNLAKERFKKTSKGKERWKRAFIKVKQIHKSKLGNVSCAQNQRKIREEKARERKEAIDGGSSLGINDLEENTRKIRDEEDFKLSPTNEVNYSPESTDSKSDERPRNVENICLLEELNEDTCGQPKEDKSTPSNNSENEEISTNGITFSNDSTPPSVKKDIYLIITNNGSSQQINKDEGTSQNNEDDLTTKISDPLENSQNSEPEPGERCENENSNVEIKERLEETVETDTDAIKKEIHKMASTFSPEIQRELKNLYENISIYEEMETKKVKPFREIRQQSFDSSLDSESGYPIKQEPQFVQVEVQINSVLPDSEISSQTSDDSISENFQKIESYHDNGEYFDQDDDFNDDDDVIVR